MHSVQQCTLYIMRSTWYDVYKLIVAVALVCSPGARAGNDWLVRVYPPTWRAQSIPVSFFLPYCVCFSGPLVASM